MGLLHSTRQETSNQLSQLAADLCTLLPGLYLQVESLEVVHLNGECSIILSTLEKNQVLDAMNWRPEGGDIIA